MKVSAASINIFRLFKLPAAWFMGIRVKSLEPTQCVVSLPYSWRAQNPFKSTYFAAQCAAGELSTGSLALLVLQDKPKVSMLVTKIEAEFFKKADKTLLFTCSDGLEIASAIQRALDTGVAQQLVATSTGQLPDGVVAARVLVTWSFKAK